MHMDRRPRPRICTVTTHPKAQVLAGRMPPRKKGSLQHGLAAEQTLERHTRAESDRIQRRSARKHRARAAYRARLAAQAPRHRTPRVRAQANPARARHARTSKHAPCAAAATQHGRQAETTAAPVARTAATTPNLAPVPLGPLPRKTGG